LNASLIDDEDYFLVLLQIAALQLFGQRDTVRWYRQNDNSIRRMSNNAEIFTYPRSGRNQLVVVEEYDSNNHLRSRKTTIDEQCVNGTFFEFYENGSIKTVGEYAHTASNNNCALKDGLWLSLSITGDTCVESNGIKENSLRNSFHRTQIVFGVMHY
jgi:hypothetical protein